MYLQRSGYRAPHEAVATHCRRRFRLTPSPNADPSIPPPDSSLWIIHYCASDVQHRFPASQIRVSEPVRLSMSERMHLQRNGQQLVRKEFMLRDSASWPTVNLPGNPGPSYAQQTMGYPGDVISHLNRSQQQVYQQQAQAAQRGMGPSPAKRPRHGPPGQVSATAIPAPAVPPEGYDDEDGLSGRDYMDFLTPRDISLHRYIQHHEWLEEILNSPYDTSQIIPGQLGMGRKGELESLTRDFFDAPINPTPKESFKTPDPSQFPIEDTPSPRVGRMEAGKAEEFTKRATERVAQINAEMEKLKQQHTRRMAKLNKGRVFKEAEESIRASTLELMNGNPSKAGTEEHKADEVVAKMEAFVGKPTKPMPEMECVQKGGLEEKAQAKENSDQDYDMTDNFVQFDAAATTAPTYSEPSNPDFTNPTISVNDTSQIPPTQAVPSEQPPPSMNDNTMNEANKSPEDKGPTGAEDWIMVSKEGTPAAEEEDHDMAEFDSFAADAAMQPNMDTPNAADDDNTAGNAHDDHLHAFNQGTADDVDDTAGNFDTNDFGDAIDFGDLDTAGEELAGYGQEMDDDDDDGNAGLDGVQGDDIGASDTFGEAFQDTEAGSALKDLEEPGA